MLLAISVFALPLGLASPAMASEPEDPIVCGGVKPDAWVCLIVLDQGQAVGAEACVLGTCKSFSVQVVCVPCRVDP